MMDLAVKATTKRALFTNFLNLDMADLMKFTKPSDSGCSSPVSHESAVSPPILQSILQVRFIRATNGTRTTSAIVPAVIGPNWEYSQFLLPLLPDDHTR
jgi:hypothetical protein